MELSHTADATSASIKRPLQVMFQDLITSSGLGGCHASVEEGTPYPCTQQAIERTCRVSRRERFGEHITAERALEDLAQINRLDIENPAAIVLAVARISEAVARCLNHEWERDIVVKVCDTD